MIPQLTVEMVPKTCWGRDLQRLLPRSQWNFCREWASATDDGACVACGEDGCECCERWAYIEQDDGRRVQRLVGFTWLCDTCLRVTRIDRISTPVGDPTMNLALGHLAAVNDWDQRQTIDYFREQRAEWARRGEHEWELDISWLTRMLGIDASPRK